MGRPVAGRHAWPDRLSPRQSGRIRARARFRDVDGVLRPVTRWGTTEAEADALLRVALREWACCGDREIGTTTRLASAGVAGRDRPLRSGRQYPAAVPG